jgi:hypothetical protein
MTVATEHENDDVRPAAEADPPAANDNEHASQRAPRRGVRESAPISVTIGWRYSEARLALARALGEIAADLWLSGKLRLTEDHTVATIDHAHGAPQDDTDQERDREAANLGV